MYRWKGNSLREMQPNFLTSKNAALNIEDKK